MDPQASKPETRALRVLIVDDNEDAADMLARLVRVDGHEVRTAYNGASALKRCEEYSPQIIFLDLNLPDIHGLEVARTLRKRPGGDRLMLIAVTGMDSDEDRDSCLEAGFNHHAVKPIRLADLREFLSLAS